MDRPPAEDFRGTVSATAYERLYLDYQQAQAELAQAKHKLKQFGELNAAALVQLACELKPLCNRYMNGSCQTLVCLQRGGYERGQRADYALATCAPHEHVQVLEALLKLLDKSTRTL